LWRDPAACDVFRRGGNLRGSGFVRTKPDGAGWREAAITARQLQWEEIKGCDPAQSGEATGDKAALI